LAIFVAYTTILLSCSLAIPVPFHDPFLLATLVLHTMSPVYFSFFLLIEHHVDSLSVTVYQQSTLSFLSSYNTRGFHAVSLFPFSLA
jgi:hypothetical protein